MEVFKYQRLGINKNLDLPMTNMYIICYTLIYVGSHYTALEIWRTETRDWNKNSFLCNECDILVSN